jgi:hypothetical protein
MKLCEAMINPACITCGPAKRKLFKAHFKDLYGREQALIFYFESVKIMVNQGTDNLQSRGQSPLKLVYSIMNLHTTGCQTQPKPWIR